MIRDTTYQAFDALTEALRGRRSAVLTTHINPDCDGLGSQIALAGFLRSQGIDVRVLNHQPVPPHYRFLDPDGGTLLQYQEARDAAFLTSADLILVVDTNHPDRLGSLADHVRQSTARIAVIDHHLDPDGFAHVVVSDDAACATGEIVYRYLGHRNALPPSPPVATALYAAIMTDTGSFRFPKTDAAVHRIIAELIEAGADPTAIFGNIYEKGTPNRLQLLGRVLSTLELHHGGRTCLLTVTRDMFAETETSEMDTDMFVTYGLTIEGVSVSVMVSELPDGAKVNVRSKGTIPANEIARAFGGNGHLNAAGARLGETDLQQLVTRLLTVTQKHLPKD